MASLYSDTPILSYTLEEFIVKSNSLIEQSEERFITFTLTGEIPDAVEPDIPHQAVVDTTLESVQPFEFIDSMRDYDSLIGVAETIAVKSSIYIYPIPNPTYVMSSSVHLKVMIEDRPTPVHNIPNFQFACWGERHMLHIFFPRLVTEAQGRHLSYEQKQSFYDKGLRPTIAHIRNIDLPDWPADFESEMFRISKGKSGSCYGTKAFAAHKVPALTPTLRGFLTDNGVDWADDFFFLHTIRGVKNPNKHSVTSEAAEQALVEFLEAAQLIPTRDADELDVPFDVSELTNSLPGFWFIDVGLEYSSSAENCLQWSTASHYHVVKEALEISEHHAERITKLGSSKYSRDLCSHLTGVSGCRIEPGPRAEGLCEAAYLQMYTTDKSQTYSPQGLHHGKAMSAKQAMSPSPCKFLTDLFHLYCVNSEQTFSNARIEVRVPIRHACRALIGIDQNVVEGNLLSFEKADWWLFHAFRTLAIYLLLKKQTKGDPSLRVRPDALLLTAACVWLVNGLHSRPDDGSAARSLMKAVLPLTQEAEQDQALMYRCRNRRRDEDSDSDENEDDDGDERGQPGEAYCPYGMIFLRRIKIKVNVPRMRMYGPSLSEQAFYFFFGNTIDNISRKYSLPGIVPRGAAPTRRIPNKIKKTPTYISLHPEEEEPSFHLAERGYRFKPAPVDDGSDLDPDEEQEEEQIVGEGGGIDKQLQSLWRQFLIDIAMKASNPRAHHRESYLKLDADDRLGVTEEFYKNLNLSDWWRACRYKVASGPELETAFGHLFPPPEQETLASSQNYRNCTYYLDWKRICSRMDKAAVMVIRRELKKKVMQLEWIPRAQQDKMWCTSQKWKGTRLPPGSDGPAPQILMIRRRPNWNRHDDDDV